MQKYKDFQPTPFDSKANFFSWDSEAIEDIQEYWVLLSRNRDSDLLSESNFKKVLESLGGESDTVQIHRFGHWACGWYELLLVHPYLTERAEEICDALNSYPVWDEEDLSERELDESIRIWKHSDLKDRLHYLKYCSDHSDSIFVIRRNELPQSIYSSELANRV
jgi:hypothetical protein